MSRVIKKVRSLEAVPDEDRRYPEEYASRIRAELRKLLEELGSEGAAGAVLDGLSQSGFHRAIKETSQPSLRVLLSLAKYLKRSPDSILGFAPQASPTADDIADKVLERLNKRPSTVSSTPPPSSVKRPSTRPKK
jgi:hypothetical protein